MLNVHLTAILMLCVLGALSPRSLIFARTTPAELAILGAWIGSLFLIRHHEGDQGWRTAREEIAEISAIRRTAAPSDLAGCRAVRRRRAGDAGDLRSDDTLTSRRSALYSRRSTAWA